METRCHFSTGSRRLNGGLVYFAAHMGFANTVPEPSASEEVTARTSNDEDSNIVIASLGAGPSCLGPDLGVDEQELRSIFDEPWVHEPVAEFAAVIERAPLDVGSLGNHLPRKSELSKMFEKKILEKMHLLFPEEKPADTLSDLDKMQPRWTTDIERFEGQSIIEGEKIEEQSARGPQEMEPGTTTRTELVRVFAGTWTVHQYQQSHWLIELDAWANIKELLQEHDVRDSRDLNIPSGHVLRRVGWTRLRWSITPHQKQVGKEQHISLIHPWGRFDRLDFWWQDDAADKDTQTKWQIPHWKTYRGDKR